METPPDLNSASRETLLAIITEQQAIIAELRRRVEYLEARPSGGGPSAGMPGRDKRSSKTREPQRTQLRRGRSHGFARRRMEPTRRVVHAPESCPECGTGLSGGWVQRRREVIEIPTVPAEVIEHLIVARVCPLCRKRRLPQAPLEGEVVGRQRFGVNLLSLLVTLREDPKSPTLGRLPIRGIQWYLQTVHQLKLSVGAIVRAIHLAARQAQPTVAAMLERIRGSPVVQADETGWREDGVNGFVWTFSTATERYFVRRGRGKGVVDEVLGESFGGVLVSDFYGAYNHYPGLKQRCWAHLLGDIHELRASYPEDAALARWAAAVQQLYLKAKTHAAAEPQSTRPIQSMLERELLSLCRPFSNDPLAPQAKLCRRIERFIKELFVFVSLPRRAV